MSFAQTLFEQYVLNRYGNPFMLHFIEDLSSYTDPTTQLMWEVWDAGWSAAEDIYYVEDNEAT